MHTKGAASPENKEVCVMFTFYYNQAGEARKPFAKAISGILGEKPRYLRAPTYAYEIDFVTVTREGNVEVDERTDSELVENLIERLAERGYEPTEASDQHATEASPVEEVQPAGEAVDVKEAQPAAEEAPVEEAQPAEEEAPVEEAQPIEEMEAQEQDEGAVDLTVSVPRSIMTDMGLDNLQKLVEAKTSLLRMAFGVEETPVIVTDDTISFPWFGGLAPSEVMLASQFISGMCRFANASKRITCKAREEDNPKFSMRVWAIRMGFSGAEHRELRRFLLRNLPGDAAFRFGRQDTRESTETTMNGEEAQRDAG